MNFLKSIYFLFNFFYINITFIKTGGYYRVKHDTIYCNNLDKSSKYIDIWYPENNNHNISIPLIVYGHGYSGGSFSLPFGYSPILSEISSWGFFIAAPRSCSYGCYESMNERLPKDPPGFKYFYNELLKTIDCVDGNEDESFKIIDKKKGVGIAGHSMGGQAALYGSLKENNKFYNVKTSVIHNVYTHSFPIIDIPFLIITGSDDKLAIPSWSKKIFMDSMVNDKIFINKLQKSHTDLLYQDYKNYSLVTAFWFKLYLTEIESEMGNNYYEYIYGNNEESLCSNGFGLLKECMIKNKRNILN